MAYVKGYEHDTIKHSDKMGEMTFEEWLGAKSESQDILSQEKTGEEIKQGYIKEYKEGKKKAEAPSEKASAEEATPEEESYQYHATKRSSLVGIAEKGLKPNKGHFGKGVYLADSEDDALEWTAETSTGGRTVLRVNERYLKKGDFDKYTASESDYGRAESIFGGIIPLDQIQIKVNDNGDEDDWWSLANFLYNNKSLYRSLNKKTQKEVDRIVHEEFVEAERRRAQKKPKKS